MLLHRPDYYFFTSIIRYKKTGKDLNLPGFLNPDYAVGGMLYAELSSLAGVIPT
jgi:hypothetical protein